MIYFHLNLENYKGETTNITSIRELFLSFFREVFLSEKVNVYINIFSQDPEFINYPSIYNANMFFISIEYEKSEFSAQDIKKSMERANTKIIPKLNKSLNDFGLKYDFIIDIPTHEVENAWKDYMAENNLEIALESIGNKNMSLEEKINFISSELLNIGSENNMLTIMDPYVLPNKCPDDYWDFIVGFIKKSKLKKIKLITSSLSQKYNKDSHNKLKKELDTLSIPLTVLENNNFHDRVWIIEKEKKGFVCGCSLNGIGKNPCVIAPLPLEDIMQIIKEQIDNLEQEIKLE